MNKDNFIYRQHVVNLFNGGVLIIEEPIDCGPNMFSAFDDALDKCSRDKEKGYRYDWHHYGWCEDDIVRTADFCIDNQISSKLIDDLYKNPKTFVPTEQDTPTLHNLPYYNYIGEISPNKHFLNTDRVLRRKIKKIKKFIRQTATILMDLHPCKGTRRNQLPNNRIVDLNNLLIKEVNRINEILKKN